MINRWSVISLDSESQRVTKPMATPATGAVIGTPLQQHTQATHEFCLHLSMHTTFKQLLTADSRACFTATEYSRQPGELLSLNLLHLVQKKRPPKHVQITLRIENDSHYFSLYHEKSSTCNIYKWNFTTTSLSIAEILLFIKKMVVNCRRQHCQWTGARNAYLRPPIDASALCVSVYVIFA